MASDLCICGAPRRQPGQRYCHKCHAEHMRRTRPRYVDMTENQRKRADARSMVKTYVTRGVVGKDPCAVCGTTTDVQGHHHDYDRPLDVTWLCREHHLAHHGMESHI